MTAWLEVAKLSITMAAGGRRIVLRKCKFFDMPLKFSQKDDSIVMTIDAITREADLKLGLNGM